MCIGVVKYLRVEIKESKIKTSGFFFFVLLLLPAGSLWYGENNVDVNL